MMQLWVLMVVLVTGGLALVCLQPSLCEQRSRSLLHRAPQAFGVGAALLFLVFLLLSFFGRVSLAGFYLPPLLLAIGVALRRPRWRSMPIRELHEAWSVPEKLLLLLLSVLLLAGMGMSLSLPLLDWDARMLWAFKAKLLSGEATLAGEAFRDPYRLHIHPRYPVLVPWLSALAAWHQGGFTESSYQVLIWFTAVLGVWQFYLLARCRMARQTALLLTLLMVGTGSWLTAVWNARVEVATVAFLLLALDALYSADEPDIGQQLIAGLLLFALAMTKNEGMLLATGLLISVLLSRVCRFGRVALQASFPLGAAFLLPLLAWFLHLRQIPGVSDENYLQRLRPEFLVEGLQRGDDLLLALFSSTSDLGKWHLFWGILPIVILLSCRRGVWQRKEGGFYAACALIYLAGVLLVYLVSPWRDIGDHVAATFERIMLPLLPLTLLMLGHLFPAVPEAGTGSETDAAGESR